MGSFRWLDVLQHLVYSYNRSYNRSIGMVPVEVDAKDVDRIWTRLYGDGDTELKRKDLPVGTMVRINKAKGVFSKG